eukprot:492265-Amphidinium_carterae.1
MLAMGMRFQETSSSMGCRIVQKCIDAAEGQGRIGLIVSICHNTLHLVQDRFHQLLNQSRPQLEQESSLLSST